MFVLSRMVIRAVVLAAAVATVISVAAAFQAQSEWQSLEAHAESAIDWLTDLLGRLGDIDPSVGDITLADLTSPQGWIDLGAGLLGGGEQPAEIDPVDVARVVDTVEPSVRLEDLTLGELAELQALGIDLAGLDLAGLDPAGTDLGGLDLARLDVAGLGALDLLDGLDSPVPGLGGD